MKKNHHLLTGLICLLSITTIKGQSVTEIVSDFQGYWRSGINPNVNPISPNNSNNLASFTWNGIRYSTGVNDAMLTSNGLTFTPGNYKALPISGLSAPPTTSTYIGLGQMYDGVAGASTPPPTNNIPYYLTDGINGLNLGTAVYNLPASNLVFEVGLFNIARIGDGIPDLIVTQVGEIPTTSRDTLKFIDPNGNTVGVAIALTFAGADTLGLLDNDFYNAWQNPMGFNSGFYPNNTKRAIRVFAFELSEFGLDATNFGIIDKFAHRLSGQSDQAFVAYNTSTVQILPNNNPGCFAVLPGLWLKANDGTNTIDDNQKIAAWQDRGVNSFAPEQLIVANRPQYKNATHSFNFNPYLNFDAANTLVSPNSPFTSFDNSADIFIVGRPTNNLAGKNKIIGFSRNAADNIGTGSGDFPAISYDQNGRLTIDSGSVNLLTSTNAHLNTIVVQQINYTQNSGGGTISLYTNGSPDGTSIMARDLGVWTFQLGDKTPGDNLSDLDLAELIIIPQNLSPTERNQIDTYLSIKYGITSAHDYVAGAGSIIWNLASNGGYNNNIAGIGREDCQATHRKQSKSINASALVTIAHVGLAPDNETNFNSMTNGTYLLMGDNNGSLNLQSTEVPAACYQRIGREWKVRETGTVGNIFLQAPASTSTLPVKLPAASNNSMYILVDNDGDFSTGLITVIPMTLNGSNWEGSYNFADGNYFTFATSNGINMDHHDLSSPWPVASAVINGCNTNGDAVINIADINRNRPMVWAGTGLTAESIAVSNPNASMDVGDDGIVLPPVLSRYNNNVFTVLLNGNIPSSTVHYRMWIDWNADGNFGNDLDGNGIPASYAGSDVITGSAAKSVAINVLPPAGVYSNFAVRLLVSTSAIANNYLSNPGFTYTLTNGEVEDHFYPMTILPVTLQSFNGTVQSCKVILKWKTASEIDSRDFNIEMSNDGINYTIVATLPASNEPNGADYSFTHENNSPGNYQYRLKINDTDGKFEYSNILNLRVGCGEIKITVSPNPTASILNIKGLAGSETIVLSDPSGRIIYTKRATPNYSVINMAPLADGIYFLTIANANQIIIREKIIKVN